MRDVLLEFLQRKGREAEAVLAADKNVTMQEKVAEGKGQEVFPLFMLFGTELVPNKSKFAFLLNALNYQLRTRFAQCENLSQYKSICG